MGYVAPTAPGAFDHTDALSRLRAVLPAALVPMIATVDTLPTRTSGKVDRAALPWPLPLAGTGAPTGLAGTQAWLAERCGDVLGTPPASADDDFFASGGTSLGAARLVSLLRQAYPGVSVADVYQHRTVRAQAALLDEAGARESATRTVAPVPAQTGVDQTILLTVLHGLVGLRWVVALVAVNNVLAWSGSYSWAPTVSWWWVLAGWLLLFSPPGRIAIAAGGARLLLRGVRPGRYPRGGSVHVRLWTAEKLAALSGVGVLSATPKRAKAGTSWLGMPPIELPRAAETADETRPSTHRGG